MNADVVSFLSGLVGAVIGVVASWGIYMVGRTRDEKAAIRAVLAEASVNDAALQSMAVGKPQLGPITSAIFQGNLPKVASRLSDAQMIAVAAPFAYATWCETVRQRLIHGEPIDDWERENLKLMQRLFAEATEVLRLRS